MHHLTHINTGKERNELRFYLQENAHTLNTSHKFKRSCFKKGSYIFSQIHFILIPAISDLYKMEDSSKLSSFLGKTSFYLPKHANWWGFFGGEVVLNNCDPPMLWVFVILLQLDAKTNLKKSWLPFNTSILIWCLSQVYTDSFGKGSILIALILLTNAFGRQLTNKQHSIIPWKKILFNAEETSTKLI